MTWHQAKNFCEENDSFLADILDEDTQIFLLQNLGESDSYSWWLGGNDIDNVRFFYLNEHLNGCLSIYFLNSFPNLWHKKSHCEWIEVMFSYQKVDQ